jgi:hypothetical protein
VSRGPRSGITTRQGRRRRVGFVTAMPKYGGLSSSRKTKGAASLAPTVWWHSSHPSRNSGGQGSSKTASGAACMEAAAVCRVSGCQPTDNHVCAQLAAYLTSARTPLAVLTAVRSLRSLRVYNTEAWRIKVSLAYGRHATETSALLQRPVFCACCVSLTEVDRSF